MEQVGQVERELRPQRCAEGVEGIPKTGFRLPAWHGMFGRGVYFADCPLKSLRYTGWGVGRKYMLVCDVEMGRSEVVDNDLDPVWNEEFEFTGTLQELTAHGLQLKVFDKDFLGMGDDRLGNKRVPLAPELFCRMVDCCSLLCALALL